MGKVSDSDMCDREVECLEATGVVTDILLTSDSYTGDGVEGSGVDDSLDLWHSFSRRFKRLVVARGVFVLRCYFSALLFRHLIVL